MMGPWEKYQQQDDPYAITQPVSPTQQVGIDNQRANTTRTRQEIENNPLNVANTKTNIAQGRQQLQLGRVKAETDLAESFRNDKTVAAYREVMPQVATAMGAGEGGPADISVIYAWAKAMDPTGSVKDQDVQLGQSATGPMQQARFLISQYHLEKGGKLPPEVRTGLIEQMRNKARALDHQYSAVHDHYVKVAKASDLDPSIIGPHEGEMYRQQEEAYIRAHGGQPHDPAEAVPPLRTTTEGGFGLEQPKTIPGAEDFRAGLYSAMRGKQVKSYEDIVRYTEQFNQQHGTHFPPPTKDKGLFNAIAASLKGKKFDVALPQYDARTLQKVKEMERNAGRDTAVKAGVKDAITVGGADELQGAVNALGQSLRGEGSFGDLYGVNRDAARIYRDFQQQTRPFYYAGGQLAGSMALPGFGARSPLEMARLGAAYGGAYGFNSGEGGIGNRLSSGVEGMAAGAVTAPLATEFLGAGNIGRSLAARNAGRRPPIVIPPLVDPATLELNQPMDAMSSAQRYQALRDAGISNPPLAATGGRTARIIDQGLTNLPPSAGIMEDAASPIARDIRNGADKVAGDFGSARSQNEIGAATQKGLGAWIARAKGEPGNPMDRGVIGKAYDAIPIHPDSPTSTGNTVSILQNFAGRFQSNPDLAEMVNNPTFAKYLDALQKHGLSWQDMKDLRSMIGEKIGERLFGENDSVGDLRALYGALSEDMRQTAAARGPQALRAFARANGLNKAVEDRIEGAFVQLLGPDAAKKPEAAAQAIQNMTKSKGGDLRTLQQVYASMKKSGQWNEVAAGMIRLGGLPAGGEGRAWNPQTFVNWYSDMAESARAMVFGNGELRKSLDSFVAANQQLSRVKALTNTSQTTPTYLGASAIKTAAGGAGAALVITNPLLALKAAIVGTAAAGLNYGAAKLWTWTPFIRWATGYTKTLASGNANAMRSQAGRLAKLAATNPELREPLIRLQQRLFANDNFAPALSANPDEEQNQQQPY
jgi:hypothetical protein